MPQLPVLPRNPLHPDQELPPSALTGQGKKLQGNGGREQLPCSFFPRPASARTVERSDVTAWGDRQPEGNCVLTLPSGCLSPQAVREPLRTEVLPDGVALYGIDQHRDALRIDVGRNSVT